MQIKDDRLLRAAMVVVSKGKPAVETKGRLSNLSFSSSITPRAAAPKARFLG